METIRQLFEETFLNISIGQFAIALGILIFALLIKKLIGQLFLRVLCPFAARTRSDYDDKILLAMRKPVEFLVVIIGLFIALQTLQLPTSPVNLRLFGQALLKLLVTFDIAWAMFNLVAVIDSLLNRWAGKTESELDDHIVPFIRKSLRVFIVVIAVIMAIQNLGYSISGLLASLGIGGLAVALAAKDTLANVFGSIMILLDRPFGIGDWVKTGDLEGTIEEIGFRSTKIRTFAKTLITVPNSLIANQSIDNISRMPKRRIKLTVGVTYETTPDQMDEAVGKIRELLRNHPAIDQEFWLVNFTDFGASSLDIMVYCFTTTTEWGEYLDARQDLCLKIMQLLEGMGLEIAFPSRTIYLQNKEGDMLPGMENPSGNS
ncbi:MAG: mechanosensitive ion channel family protein [Desulfuromonas sp.]|nr:MAG: mechanosensitive ion channel family protein [Desulfuromonas sp.]